MLPANELASYPARQLDRYAAAVSNLDDALAACAELLAAVDRRREAVIARDRAIYRMHVEDGLSRRGIADKLQEALAGQYTPEQIEAMGVSEGNVRAAVNRPRADG